jgi:hypothetical protein
LLFLPFFYARTSRLGHHGNGGRSFATQTANPSKRHGLDADFALGVAHKAKPVMADTDGKKKAPG